MTDYHVEWNTDIEDKDSPKAAAQAAWMQMREDHSIANVFVVSDDMDMTTVIDLHHDEVGPTAWVPGNQSIAELGEWMVEQGWNVSEILAMVRKPHKYADEFSQMKMDRAFDAVAKEPEAEEELEDIPVSSLTVLVSTPEMLATFPVVVTAESAKTVARQLTEGNRNWDFLKDDEMVKRLFPSHKKTLEFQLLPDGHPFEEGVYKARCQHCGLTDEAHA